MPADTVAEQQRWPLIKGIKFAMFSAHDGSGHPHARPMTTQNKTMRDDKLWFFLSARGDTAQKLIQQPQVTISYPVPGNDVYVSVSGSVPVVDDKVQRQALWTTFAQAWFPGGVGDPDLALVCETVGHAHLGWRPDAGGPALLQQPGEERQHFLKRQSLMIKAPLEATGAQ